MNWDSEESTVIVNRRKLIVGITSTATVSVAGCGDSQNEDGKEQMRAKNGSPADESGDGLPDELEEAKEDIETVFARLSNLPVIQNDEFVFDVDFFEDEFDHQELRRTMERAVKRLEEIDVDAVSESRIEGLIAVAEIGRLLVAQRVMVHQIIAAGFTVERQIYRIEYDRAVEVVRDTHQFLENLRTTGKQIEKRLSPVRKEISVEGYDPPAIEGTQESLVEIVRWTEPAYEALHHAILGFKKFDEGNDALETDRYDVAGSSYGDSEGHFEAAAEAFDEAQGRGRRIPPLVPLVEGIRCLLPAYLSSCGRLQRSMEEFDAGNEVRAREIARDALSSADEKAARCF